jgi:hypothetical protein
LYVYQLEEYLEYLAPWIITSKHRKKGKDNHNETLKVRNVSSIQRHKLQINIQQHNQQYY